MTDSYGLSPHTNSSFGFNLEYTVNLNNSGRNSYGHHFICSPDNRFNTAWWVGLSGVCDSWMRDGVTYSYGSPSTDYNYGTWFVRSSGVVDYNFGNSIGDSYG